jgi:NAD(P)-dependent dehydrogenase (short-subunit alcohol dehydrogenase family)
MTAARLTNLLIFGAASDIGTTLLTEAAGRRGMNIIGVTRSTRIRKPPRRAKILEGVDLTKEADLTCMAEEVAQQFKGPFGIVHSVGDFWVHKPLVETPFAEIERMIASQVLTLFGVARYLTPVMRRNGGGRLVAFSCNSVTYNYPDMAPFTASKAAVESFVKCYANEHSELGIAATALALPTIRTRTVLKEKPTGDARNYIRPEDLAKYVLDHVLTLPHEVNGNVIKLFKYSPTFYHQSYYERNPHRSSQAKSRQTTRNTRSP